MKNNQKVIGSIILIGVVVLAGYFILSKNNSLVTQQMNTVTPGKTNTSTTAAGYITTKINSKIYTNKDFGFQVTLPDETWVAGMGEVAVELYNHPECRFDHFPEEIPASCGKGKERSFTVSTDTGSDGLQKPDAVFTAYSKNSYFSGTKELPSLIPGAIVIKSDFVGDPNSVLIPEEPYYYSVFFLQSKKQFIITTNNIDLEKDVLPSFELIK